jgi:group I intron endonuclease
MIVYLLWNQVNGKAYVGQHAGFQLDKRWNKTLSGCRKTNRHLAAAVQKYGANNFSRTILCYAFCQQELDLLEQFWIAAYKSTDPRFGYNQQSGGRIWRAHYTRELRQLISEGTRKAWAKKSAKEKWEFAFAMKIKWLMRTERQRQRITSAIRNWPRKGRKLGPQQNPCGNHKPLTEEHKQRISKALRRSWQRRQSEKG